MGAVGYRFRAELRTTGRQLLVTAVVLGLAVGLALAALAGARRTMSAAPRLLAETGYADVLVNPDLGAESALDPADVLALPGVDGGTHVAGVATVPVDASGEGPDLDAEGFELFALSDGVTRDRPLITEGRELDSDAPDEIVLSPDLADELDLRVGDTLDQFIVDLSTYFACPDPDACPEALTPVTFRVVGLGRLADEIVDPAVEEGRAITTAAFLREHQGSAVYWALLLHLDRSTPVEDVRIAVTELVPDEAVAFETTSGQLERFQRSVRPQAVAMAGFGVVVGAAALLFACLALVRLAAAMRADRRVVVSMGAEPRAVSVLGGAHGLVCAAAGGLVAIIVAVVLSPLAPIGLARPAEPDPGVALDMAVLGAGVLVSVLLLGAVAAASTNRTLRPGADRRPARASSGARALANLGAGPALVLGARSALERGRGPHAVPVRSTIATVVVALAGVIAAVSFGASLTHLLGTPSEHGVNWDVLVNLDLPTDADGPEVDGGAVVADRQEEAVDAVLARPDVDGLSVLTFSSVGLAGDDVPAMGLEVRAGSAHPTLVEGRAPATADEVVLARSTLRDSGALIGRSVGVGDRDVEVVGTAVFPGYAEYPGQDPTDLGSGAWFTIEGLEATGTVFTGRSLLVSVTPGVDPRAAFDGYTASGFVLTSEDIQFDAFRPSTVANLERVRSTPVLIALALGALGVVATVNVLVLSVRRRRPELGMLRALGFSRRQMMATVGWQAVLMAVVAAVVGVPLGIVLGRLSWNALIDQLGGVSPPVVPVPAIVAVVAVTLALAYVAAVLPARSAARTRPATVLRVE